MTVMLRNGKQKHENNVQFFLIFSSGLFIYRHYINRDNARTQFEAQYFATRTFLIIICVVRVRELVSMLPVSVV